MKRLVLIVRIIVIFISMTFCMFACDDADTIQRNLSISADHFDVYRKVTVINLRSDTILLEAEGLISIKDSSST